jgi:hypothetical protein
MDASQFTGEPQAVQMRQRLPHGEGELMHIQITPEHHGHDVGG